MGGKKKGEKLRRMFFNSRLIDKEGRADYRGVAEGAISFTPRWVQRPRESELQWNKTREYFNIFH